MHSLLYGDLAHACLHVDCQAAPLRGLGSERSFNQSFWRNTHGHHMLHVSHPADACEQLPRRCTKRMRGHVAVTRGSLHYIVTAAKTTSSPKLTHAPLQTALVNPCANGLHE